MIHIMFYINYDSCYVISKSKSNNWTIILPDFLSTCHSVVTLFPAGFFYSTFPLSLIQYYMFLVERHGQARCPEVCTSDQSLTSALWLRKLIKVQAVPKAAERHVLIIWRTGLTWSQGYFTDVFLVNCGFAMLYIPYTSHLAYAML